MDVIGTEYMIKPNLCLSCEMTPDPGSRVIDTLRDLSVGGVPATADAEAMDPVTHLSGRKYVCEACATDFAIKFGWTKPADVETLSEELSSVRGELNALKLSTEAGERVLEALKAADLFPEERPVDAPSHEIFSMPGYREDS